MGFISVETDGNYTTYDDKGHFAGGGQINNIPSIKALGHGGTSFNGLQSQIDELRAKAEEADFLLHRRANGQASHGSDPELEEAMRAKRQYFQQCEDEEDQLVDDSVFLANGGTVKQLMEQKGTYAELHILNKTAEARRLKKFAAGDKLSSEDETWIQEMLGLAGQEKGG
jgi:hypothetical protein